jgi:hypothetical protein
MMTWNFFGTRRGKRGCEWDGARAMVKQELRNENFHNPERGLENVEDCVPFFSNIMSSHVLNSYESP